DCRTLYGGRAAYRFDPRRARVLWPRAGRGRVRPHADDRDALLAAQTQPRLALGAHVELAAVPYLHRAGWAVPGLAAHLLEVQRAGGRGRAADGDYRHQRI